MKNYYKILNIDSLSTPEEIKAAYRRLAKEHHPDRGGDPGLFCDIQEAYDGLSNPARRVDYGRRRSREPFGGEAFRTVSPHVRRPPVDVFDDLVDVLSRRFGFEGELVYDVDIVLTSAEAARGVNLELRVPVERICDRCFGFGGTLLADCGRCNGTGILAGHDMAYLKINPRARDGDSLVARSGDIVFKGIIEIAE